MHLYAGTSGYSYAEWRGHFYPDDLPTHQMLRFYARQLPAVEINNTFYRFPKPSLLETWMSQVPEDFRFSIKASQKITHIKRLTDAADETAYLINTVRSLGTRLGVLFFQLPPFFRKDLQCLEEFLALLPDDIKTAFEFRHATWFDETVFDCLHRHNRALCIADTDDELKVPLVATADWGYVRLRKARYTKPQLASWLETLSSQPWKEAFVFFKHEDKGVGAKLATSFLTMAQTEREREQLSRTRAPEKR